jgi:hypothetical protein
MVNGKSAVFNLISLILGWQADLYYDEIYLNAIQFEVEISRKPKRHPIATERRA